MDAAREVGKLLEDLPSLWVEADPFERRKLLLTMLDAVCVDTVEEKSIVAIRPKPAFQPLFEVATTKEGSGVVMIHEKELPPVPDNPEATTSPCLWWRLGRLDIEPSILAMGLYPLLLGTSALQLVAGRARS